MRESTPLSSPTPPHDPSSLATLDREQTALQIKLADDPWSLTHRERLVLRDSLADAQGHWLPRIEGLVEPPAVDAAFPAFLLETTPFAPLARAIGDTQNRVELDTGTADALQHFVDRYRSFLSAE